MPVGKSRNSSMDFRPHGYDAWVAGLDQKIPYDLGPLARGEAVRTFNWIDLTGFVVHH